MKFDAAKILNDKRVLYVVLFLAITNLVGYLMSKNYTAILFFLLTCLFVRFFNQNKTIIFGSALIATTLAIGGKMIKENLRNKKKEGFDSKQKESDMKNAKRARSTKEKPATKSGMTNIHDDDETDAGGDNGNQEKIATGKKSQLDYAGTVESAYDNLDKLLSSDALKNMGMDTQRLAEKQKKLMGSIKNLEPMMNQANDLLKSLDMSGINNMMSKISNMSIINDGVGGEHKKKE